MSATLKESETEKSDKHSYQHGSQAWGNDTKGKTAEVKISCKSRWYIQKRESSVRTIAGHEEIKSSK